MPLSKMFNAGTQVWIWKMLSFVAISAGAITISNFAMKRRRLRSTRCRSTADPL